MQQQPCHLPIMREIASGAIITAVGPYVTNWFLFELIIFFVVYILMLEYLKRYGCLEAIITQLRSGPNQLKTVSEQRSSRFSRRAVSFPEIRRQSDSNLMLPKLHHETRRQSDGHNLSQPTDGRKHRFSPRVFQKIPKQTKYRQNSFKDTRQYRDQK